MSETDPFGREKSEDPLAEMGWSSPAASTEAAPSTVAPPERPDHAAQRERSGASTVRGIPGQGGKNRGGCFVAMVVLIFLVATAGAILPAVIDAVDSVDEITPTLRDRPGGDGRGDDRP